MKCCQAKGGENGETQILCEHSFPLCGGLLQHPRAAGLKMQAGLHDPKLASSEVSMMEVRACSLRRRGKQGLAAFKRTNTKQGSFLGKDPGIQGSFLGKGFIFSPGPELLCRFNGCSPGSEEERDVRSSLRSQGLL